MATTVLSPGSTVRFTEPPVAGGQAPPTSQYPYNGPPATTQAPPNGQAPYNLNPDPNTSFLPRIPSPSQQPPQARTTRSVLEEHIFDGPASIRDRDNSVKPLSALRNVNRETLSFNENPYTVWTQACGTKKPESFEPTGSFQALRDAGKLTDISAAGRASGGKEGDHVVHKKHYMPGYTGYVRGMQHTSGRTYGEATRRSLDTDYRENVCTSPIPSSPQNNLKIRHKENPNSFASHVFAGKVYHVPGYTGFVPGVRSTYARTYGSTTSQEMYKHSLKHPRPRARERPDHAYTMRPREMLVIDSAPLPGKGKTGNRAPVKLIPSHLRHLQYFAM